jgi:ATP-dependent Clp protease ATP-binding subunit ClpA
MGRLHQTLNPAVTGRDAERLEADLRARIVGQDDAIRQVLSIYQTYLAGMTSPDRPVGNFLFLGPTGSGKTRLVEALGESVFGDARAVIKIDCAEFQHSHEIAKLIGSPPGYLGHRETHPILSQEVLNQHHTDETKLSFVLFDEIEKASDALWNLLLGILDKATLTLGDGRRVDFSRAMIFLTSNLGASEMGSILRPNLGFAAGDIERQRAAGITDADLPLRIEKTAIEAARRKFTPEFMNRIDRTVVFRPLGEPQLRKILGLELGRVQHRILSSAHTAGFIFTVTGSAQDYLLQEGIDFKYGARHLRRAIDRLLVNPLSNLIATSQVRGGDLVRVDFDGARLVFSTEAEDMPPEVMARMVGGPFPPPPSAQSASATADSTRTVRARTSRR